MHLVHDTTTNTLRLLLDHDDQSVHARAVQVSGIIDIAEGGRLVGLELPPPDSVVTTDWLRVWRDDPIAREWLTVADDETVYLQLTTGDDRHARSTRIELTVDLDASGNLVSIAIPRRGAGYEISYPSGNQ